MATKDIMIYRVSYSKKRDAFSGWFYVGKNRHPKWDDFNFEIECKCLKRKPEDEEATLISYQMLTHIRSAMMLGYKLEWANKPETEEV